MSLTSDERQVLTLVAAAQAEMPSILEAYLRWLSHPEHRHVLEIAVGSLATALKVNDLELTRPADDMAPGQECKLAVA